MIRRVAVAQGVKEQADWAAWYRHGRPGAQLFQPHGSDEEALVRANRHRHHEPHRPRRNRGMDTSPASGSSRRARRSDCSSRGSNGTMPVGSVPTLASTFLASSISRPASILRSRPFPLVAGENSHSSGAADLLILCHDAILPADRPRSASAPRPLTLLDSTSWLRHLATSTNRLASKVRSVFTLLRSAKIFSIVCRTSVFF